MKRFKGRDGLIDDINIAIPALSLSFSSCFNNTFGCNNHGKHVTTKKLVVTWLLPCQGCFKASAETS